ncbi:uncharacterized protein LOC132095415 [Carassius carassius]|uniref:uncharacterized protein LOC132095415 n=1 Tax=Carassius carassius TaxID=217509 RepID=UPI002869454C|nr:uncharacterized protein LOC132095415 [Carassius carassius]
MCFQISTITTNTRRARYVRRRKACLTNLRPVPLTSTTTLSIPVGLWNCQSAVNKADFISSIATHSGLNLMALTETWIKPEDTATPAALSTNFTCSHTPRTTGRGGGTGLLISKEWKFDLQPSPTGQLGNFLEELDVLLSNFPEDGTPLVLLGDFNIHLDKPQAADFKTLLTSFDLKLVHSRKIRGCQGKIGSDARRGEVKPWRHGERVADRAESSGRDEAWSSVAVSGGEGAILGLADWLEK